MRELAAASPASVEPSGSPSSPRSSRPPRGRGKDLVAIVVLAGVLACFFAPALTSGDQLLYRDNGRMHWPVKKYVAAELRRGHFPEWNPYSSLGGPLVGGAIDAVQHPFNVLFAVFPFEAGFKLWALLSFLMAATGAFAWARILGRSTIASGAAGLAFALSGPLVGSSDNLTYLTTQAAVPWLFAAAHAWTERRTPGRLTLLGAASGLCAAGGDVQAWAFALALLPFYAALVVEPRRAGWRGWIGALATLPAAFIGAAPFVLPVIAWLPHSSRGIALDPFDLQRWNLPLLRLVEFVVPHMYRDAPGTLASPVYEAFGGGLASRIPWILSVYVGASVVALCALAVVRARSARWLMLAAVLSIWLALGHHAGFGQLLPHLPVVRGFRYWEKMAIWPSLFLAVAAAYGLDEVIARRAVGRWATGVIAVAVGALALWCSGRIFSDDLVAILQRSSDAGAAATFANNLLDGVLEAGALCLLLGLVALALERGVLRPRLAPLVAIIAVADPFAANIRGYVLAQPEVVEQPAPLGDYLRSQPGLQRVFTPYELTRDRWPELPEFAAGWMWASRMLAPAFNVKDAVANFVPYSGMMPGRVDRFLRRAPMAQRLPHIGIFGVGHLAVPGALENARAAGLAPPYEVVAVDPVLPAFLLRVPHRDRAYLAEELTAVDRRNAMEFVLSVDPARTRASVLEAPVPVGYEPAAGQARIVVDASERVVVETMSDRRALLVLNDTYAPGWTARVDGVAAEILPANYLARGVWVDAGRHSVAFVYRTPWLRAGWAIFLTGLIATLAVAGLRTYARRRQAGA